MPQRGQDELFDLDFRVDAVTKHTSIAAAGTESCETCGCTTSCDTCGCTDSCDTCTCGETC